MNAVGPTERGIGAMMDPGADLVPVAELSAALDEVYRLRRALAYEAGVIEAHLTLASFPKSRRTFAMDQVHRMRASARGDAQDAYKFVRDESLRFALREAGASETLTRAEFGAVTPYSGPDDTPLIPGADI